MGKKSQFWIVLYNFNFFWTILDGHSFKSDGELKKQNKTKQNTQKKT